MTTLQLQQTLVLIDAANAEDPNQEKDGDKTWPKELLYSERMSSRLDVFMPDAPEVLQIAVRAQHIQRWKIPRSDYPKTRPGYLQWRKELGKFHAEQTAAIMQTTGYSGDDQDTVKALLTKQQIKQNPLTQALEDVICLVFIQYYLEDFSADYDSEKLANIIRKTWAKMSESGQQAALKLPLSSDMLSVISAALSHI